MQQLTIPVANVVDLLGQGYTTIEVWSAPDHGEIYSEVTSSSAAPAVLQSAAASTKFDMGGRTLKLVIDGGTEHIISFDPLLRYWSPQQVATRINQIVPSLASAVGWVVILTSPTTGRMSTIQITYSDSPNLGWSAGDQSVGTASRLTLDSNTVLYQFSDAQGTKDTLYKWRFSVGGLNPTEFSPYTHGMGAPVVGVTISIGTATFTDAMGRPVKRQVIITNDLATPSGVGSVEPITVESDDNGFLQVPLAAGLNIVVGFEGTTLVRRITVPSTPTFDLISAAASVPDPFSVQTVPPLLIRQNLGE